MQLTYIYAHVMPFEDEIFYIGKANDPWARLAKHINAAKTEKHYQANKLRSLMAQGTAPRVEIIAEVPVEDWEFWERHYIKYFRNLGFHLTNATPGGDGTGSGPESPTFGKKHSAEVRGNIRRACVGRIISPEQRAAHSLAMSGAGNPNFGKPHNLNTRIKISSAKTGKLASAQARKNQSIAQTGGKCPDASSRFKGVSWSTTRQRWCAGVIVAGKRVYLGRHIVEEDAARAVDAYVRLHKLPSTLLNFSEA